MSYYIPVLPTTPTSEEKDRREEIFLLTCYHFSKLKNHVITDCDTFKKEVNSCYEIDCEICSKVLCFLDLMIKWEKKKGKEVDIEKMVKSGIIDHMIFGNGIKLLE